MEQSLSKYRTIHVAKKSLWTPARKGIPMQGLVSDIKVWDNYHDGDGLHPLTGKQKKLIDFNKGGHNTISSGATAQMLQLMFATFSDGFTTRYFDGTYYFPCFNDFYGGTPSATSSLDSIAPMSSLFANIVGIKGGTGGLTGKQSVLTPMNWAWQLGWPTYSSNQQFQSGDQYVISGAITKSITMTRSLQTAGQPAQYTWNVTVTSNSNALAYTIDSIGWVPRTNNGGNNSFFVPSTTNPNGLLAVNTTALGYTSQTNSPTNNGSYITALFILPYLITVNPNGAFQFTYTFQGN